ncbi:hypothetical protein [Brucella anthropi]|uniref:hypothetical protein n=1 Tax=Brucella anthropi TaxID=529 RepID=UPI0023617B35|nr:hypothetical protein [Brucella anthropi]
MLSDCLREMRRECQKALLDADDSVQISLLRMQSYVLALAVYEDTARDQEQQLEALRNQIIGLEIERLRKGEKYQLRFPPNAVEEAARPGSNVVLLDERGKPIQP